MTKRKPIVIKGCVASSDADYKKRIEKWIESQRPKEIGSYTENGVVVRVIESRPAAGTDLCKRIVWN